MLNAIRHAAANWLGRAVLTVIMGVLILSFAIWGIGDIFRGSTDRTVASVGKVKISSEDFRAAFSTALQNLQQQMRRQITLKEAQQQGLVTQLLDRMLNDATLDQTLASLGMARDETSTVRAVLTQPEFLTNGQFDRSKFAEALRQSGLGEAAFLKKQGDTLLRRQMVEGLVLDMPVPETWLRIYHQISQERRDIDLLTLPRSLTGSVAPPEPDEAALKAHYEAFKAQFVTPETRKVTLLTLGRADFSAGITVSEDDLRAFYTREAARGRFGTPEKRSLQRILFDTKQDAQKAYDSLKAGTSFDALLTERKLSAADADFGTKTKAQLPPAVAESVFATLEGQVTPPLDDAFGTVLIRVGAIQPGMVQPFALVQAGLEADVRAEKLRTDATITRKIDTLSHTIEEARAVGKPLTEIAKLVERPVVELATLTDKGTLVGDKFQMPPGGQAFIRAAFASDIGLDNEPLTLPDGSHIWFEVNAVEPARQQSFEEARAGVQQALKRELYTKSQLDRAQDLLRQIEGGASLAQIAKELQVPLVSLSDLGREDPAPALGAGGMERGFSTPVGQFTMAQTPEGGGRLIIQPKAARLVAYTKPEAAIVGQFAAWIGDDLIRQYVAARREALGSTLHQNVLDQALGAQAP